MLWNLGSMLLTYRTVFRGKKWCQKWVPQEVGWCFIPWFAIGHLWQNVYLQLLFQNSIWATPNSSDRNAENNSSGAAGYCLPSHPCVCPSVRGIPAAAMLRQRIVGWVVCMSAFSKPCPCVSIEMKKKPDVCIFVCTVDWEHKEHLNPKLYLNTKNIQYVYKVLI